jgi:hypothetical protein
MTPATHTPQNRPGRRAAPTTHPLPPERDRAARGRASAETTWTRRRPEHEAKDDLPILTTRRLKRRYR